MALYNLIYQAEKPGSLSSTIKPLFQALSKYGWSALAFSMAVGSNWWVDIYRSVIIIDCIYHTIGTGMSCTV